LARAGVRCVELDLADHAATAALFRDGRYAHVAHLAAQPGVRYSLQNPAAYIRNNIDAFAAVMRLAATRCRAPGVCIELERVRRQPYVAVPGIRTSIIR
jgi:nucleoside-diphosphate-sugar epimerase